MSYFNLNLLLLLLLICFWFDISTVEEFDTAYAKGEEGEEDVENVL